MKLTRAIPTAIATTRKLGITGNDATVLDVVRHLTEDEIEKAPRRAQKAMRTVRYADPMDLTDAVIALYR